jgi:Tol biopolymer transport system component
MDFDGENRKRVTVPSLRAESPDQRLLSPAAGHSTQIVFSGWSGTNRDIYRIDPDGNLDTLQTVADMPESNESDPRWSTNGKRVAFVTDAYGAKNIQERDVETGEMTIEALLPNTAADIFYTDSLGFSYSPSGENFVVSYGSQPGSGADTLAIVDREGTIIRVLEHGLGPNVIILSPDWLGGYIPVAWWPAATSGAVVAGGAAIGVGVLGVVVYDLVDDDDDDDDDRPPRSPFLP